MDQWAVFAVVCFVGYLLYQTDKQRRRQNYLAWATLFEWLERERHNASPSEVFSGDYPGDKEEHLLKRLDRSRPRAAPAPLALAALRLHPGTMINHHLVGQDPGTPVPARYQAAAHTS